MTRKDYVEIAAAIAMERTATFDLWKRDAQANELIRVIGDVLQRDNPRFDRARFESACTPLGVFA